MKKRIAAALLWFYAGWYAWSVLAWAIGLPEIFGPVFGAALAAVFAGDPFHRIWTTARPERRTRAASPVAPISEPV